MADARATLDQYFAALCALDADGFTNAFAADARQEDPVGSPVRQGRAEIRGFFEQMGGLLAELELKPTATYWGPASAAVPWKGRGRGRNGAEVTFEGVDLFAFDAEGRIASIQAFWDAGPVLAALMA